MIKMMGWRKYLQIKKKKLRYLLNIEYLSQYIEEKIRSKVLRALSFVRELCKYFV